MTPYTAIPNSLLEKIIFYDFTKNEMKIILALLRHTIGYKCKEARLSNTYLSKKTGIDIRRIKESVKSLIEKKIIIVSKEATYSDARVLMLNDSFGSDESATSGSDKTATSGSDESAISGSDESAIGGSDESATQINKTINKNINKTIKSECERIVGLFNELCLSFPKVTGLSKVRVEKIERLLLDFTEDDIAEGFKTAERSEFLKGRKNGWKASFDWLIERGNLEKVLRGDYGGEKSLEDSFDVCDFFRIAVERDMKY